MRKLFVVIAILSGLFAFQESLAFSAPRESTRIEIVLKKAQQEVSTPVKDYQSALEFFEQQVSLKAQVRHPRFLKLLISSLQHHATL